MERYIQIDDSHHVNTQIKEQIVTSSPGVSLLSLAHCPDFCPHTLVLPLWGLYIVKSHICTLFYLASFTQHHICELIHFSMCGDHLLHCCSGECSSV